MQAIILAGGIGSRLKKVIKNVPKPMALVNGKPFLEIILNYFNDCGFQKIILSVGYLSEVIINHFGQKYKDLEITYAIEKERLGTGGAIKYAMRFSDDEDVFILNGDTFLDVNFSKILEIKKESSLPIIVSREVADVSRYGSLVSINGILEEYNEKINTGRGEINAGCYYLPTKIMKNQTSDMSFSFEQVSIPLIMKNPGFMVFRHEGVFVDIGIYKDLNASSEILRQYTNF